MNEMIEIQQHLYLKEVECLLKRRANIIERKAIKNAFIRHCGSIETAKLISGFNDRVDRQNDLA